MTRREAVLNAFYGVLGGIVADWARLRFFAPKREPWVADVRPSGHQVVKTASGKVAMFRRGDGKMVPVMTYEVICHLDGEPCPCAYANEAKGEVLIYEHLAGVEVPIWGPSRLIRKTGHVELIPNLIG